MESTEKQSHTSAAVAFQVFGLLAIKEKKNTLATDLMTGFAPFKTKHYVAYNKNILQNRDTTTVSFCGRYKSSSFTSPLF